jgi:hypothetical protein
MFLFQNYNMTIIYRLRRSGAKILGDLSFRTAGSRFNAQSTFEVIRDPECKNGQSPLRIRLPQELKSKTWISIRVEQCSVSDVLTESNPQTNTISTYQYILGTSIFVVFIKCYLRPRI